VPDAALDERSHASTARCADAKRGAGYAVYDPVGQKIGSAEEVFVNREGDPVYVRVRIGRFFSKTVLIPVQFVQTDEEGKAIVLK
jgi:PRC-barrel domain